MKLTNAVEFYSCLLMIMDHYGYDHQVYEKLPEEVDELQEAFDAYFDKPSPEHWHHVIEEAADVHIMLEQFQMLITPEDKAEFDKICMDKLHREIERIEQAGGKNGLSK